MEPEAEAKTETAPSAPPPEVHARYAQEYKHFCGKVPTCNAMYLLTTMAEPVAMTITMAIAITMTITIAITIAGNVNTNITSFA